MSQRYTLQQLRQLKLTGMADALEHQWTQPQPFEDLCFDERIGLLIDAETTSRAGKRLKRLLTTAKFKLSAYVGEVDYAHPRGLKKNQFAALVTCDWLEKKRNLIITGPTGCGKTYLACALGRQACHHDYSVRYFRASRLFESLTIAHGDGSYLKWIQQLSRTDLLIIDDWGLEKLTPSQRNDWLEIMEDRHGIKSTLVTSQLPATQWHKTIGDATLADAILDRLLHNAHKLQLKLNGDSMRKTHGSLTEEEQLG